MPSTIEHHACIIDWYGPYRGPNRFLKEAKEFDVDRTLYFCCSAVERSVNYVGLTKNPRTRFSNHDIIRLENQHYYIGEILSPRIAGRPSGIHTPDLKAAEHLLIRFLQPNLNTLLVNSDPKACISVYSRFFGKNNGDKPKETPEFFPDIVAYNRHTSSWLTNKPKLSRLT